MTDLIDPITTALAGRADLTDDFREPYGRSWGRQHTVRVRVFREGLRTLVAFTHHDDPRDHHDYEGESFTRHMDLVVPPLTQRLGLDPATTSFMEHDAKTGCLALFEFEWVGRDAIKNIKWKTFAKGDWHHYAGKDYCEDLVRWFDMNGLPARPTSPELKSHDCGSQVIDVTITES